MGGTESTLVDDGDAHFERDDTLSARRSILLQAVLDQKKVQCDNGFTSSGLRMLCLHGHGSNNDITRMQIDHLQLRELHGVSCDLLSVS